MFVALLIIINVRKNYNTVDYLSIWNQIIVLGKNKRNNASKLAVSVENYRSQLN